MYSMELFKIDCRIKKLTLKVWYFNSLVAYHKAREKWLTFRINLTAKWGKLCIKPVSELMSYPILLAQRSGDNDAVTRYMQLSATFCNLHLCSRQDAERALRTAERKVFYDAW